ncbi:MAG: ATPase, T2SS/T4P/T4SS family [Candidatus Rifleibacteriota bacterium]
MGKAEKPATKFVFTSFQGGIGKSFIAYNFVKALKEKTGKPVALIEYNYLKPSLLCETIGEKTELKNSYLDFYMGNWVGMTPRSIKKFFSQIDGVFYIPFCGNNHGETLETRFNLNEHDLSESLNHFLDLFTQLDGYVVFDLPFQLTPLPLFLMYKADVLFYIYTSQPPSPSYAQKFLEEARRRMKIKDKIYWLRNHVDPEDDNEEASLFDLEHSIPLGHEITGNNDNEVVQKSFAELVKKALQMPAEGFLPGKEKNNFDSFPEEIADYLRNLRADVLSEMEKKYGMSDHELRDQVEQKIELAFKKAPPPDIPGHNAESEVKKYLLDEILGLGPLEEFMRDDEVDEIMVNGPDKIFVEKNGRLLLTDRKFNNADHVRTVIERILMPVGRTVNERTPYVDARLSDGSRVHAIIPPLSLTGPMITIRRFSKVPYGMDDLIFRFKSLTSELAQFLELCVNLKKNIIVSGGASSGKTTLLNVLSHYILPTERVICIEDSAELKLGQTNLGRLEARQQGTEAKTQITIRDLVRNALRMRPDRIIVGECRGAEALDMLQAMNTGHDGSLTTLHANSPRDALARLETMVLMAGVDLPLRAIREQIASSVNIVVQTSRLADGNRKLLEVVEVTGIEDTIIKANTLFKFEKKWIDKDGRVIGEIVPTGTIPEFMKAIPGDFLEKHANLFKQKPVEKPEEETAQ